MPRKISSVLELARYKVGDYAWWVAFQCKNPTHELSEDEEWMIHDDIHPKTLWEHGPYRTRWPFRAKLPRLHHVDFNGVIGLLTSDLVVERFDICDIIRSNDTGEFYYSNPNDEWMPEGYLMDTDVAARRERTRILKMIKRWVVAQW